MDPITQGVLGATFAQSAPSNAYPEIHLKTRLFRAAIIGALAGMAPDLDVLIRSETDPLLAIEFHRHFTHSLFFIPLGALICSLAFYPVFAKRWQLSFWHIYFWSFIGFATHALLDGCTSYGTQLLWPLSNQRFAWDTVSVIDPLFTLPMLFFICLAVFKSSKRWVYLAIIWGGLYLGFGKIQHDRAMELATDLAKNRGHEFRRIEVKPSFANLIVWKVIYSTDDRYYVAAVRPKLINGEKSWPGESIKKLDVRRDFPWLDLNSQQAKDIERFRWFSDGFLSLDKHDSNKIVDMRYSLLPDEIAPLWGISLKESAALDEHAGYYSQHKRPSDALQKLLKMILD